MRLPSASCWFGLRHQWVVTGWRHEPAREPDGLIGPAYRLMAQLECVHCKATAEREYVRGPIAHPEPGV